MKTDCLCGPPEGFVRPAYFSEYIHLCDCGALIEIIAGYTMTAVDTDVSSVEKMFGVNVFGPMRMVHHFHRPIVDAKGLIINICSVGGVSPYVFGASYNASKAALAHYGNTLRVEMQPFG